jgi:hypothetical protein
MEERTTVGIDLAKEVFAICVLGAQGVVVETLESDRPLPERKLWRGQ